MSYSKPHQVYKASLRRLLECRTEIHRFPILLSAFPNSAVALHLLSAFPKSAVALHLLSAFPKSAVALQRLCVDNKNGNIRHAGYHGIFRDAVGYLAALYKGLCEKHYEAKMQTLDLGILGF